MATLRQAFNKYHRSNPHVYDLFKAFTFDVIKRGYQNYSAQAILERIRWHVNIDVEEQGSFKINNNHRTFYAKKFAREFPEHGDVFQFRKQA